MTLKLKMAVNIWTVFACSLAMTGCANSADGYMDSVVDTVVYEHSVEEDNAGKTDTLSSSEVKDYLNEQELDYYFSDLQFPTGDLCMQIVNDYLDVYKVYSLVSFYKIENESAIDVFASIGVSDDTIWYDNKIYTSNGNTFYQETSNETGDYTENNYKVAEHVDGFEELVALDNSYIDVVDRESIVNAYLAGKELVETEEGNVTYDKVVTSIVDKDGIDMEVVCMFEEGTNIIRQIHYSTAEGDSYLNIRAASMDEVVNSNIEQYEEITYEDAFVRLYTTTALPAAVMSDF